MYFTCTNTDNSSEEVTVYALREIISPGFVKSNGERGDVVVDDLNYKSRYIVKLLQLFSRV